MFHVFSKFNQLFIRPKIRGAIYEYQTLLIDRVKVDLSNLLDKFQQQYSGSQAQVMSQLRDIPLVSGAVIWARQIERQLDNYMARVEDVLGKGWQEQAQGKALYAKEVSFRAQLDTNSIFDTWIEKINCRKNYQIVGRIFKISLVNQKKQLCVNFNEQSISLFKEVRNLVYNGFQVPHSIVNLAKDAKRMYPFGVTLNDCLGTFYKAQKLVSANEHLNLLTAGYQKDVQDTITKGIGLRWDYFINTYDVRSVINSENRHVAFFRDISNLTHSFYEKVISVQDLLEAIEKQVAALSTCKYEHEELKSICTNIGELVAQLHLLRTSNLEQWTLTLDGRVETILVARLSSELKIFRSGTFFNSKSLLISCSLKIKNQSVYLDPPLEQAKCFWLAQLQEVIRAVTAIDRISLFKFEEGLLHELKESSCYSNLVK